MIELKITIAKGETVDVRNFGLNQELHNKLTYTLSDGATVTIDLKPARNRLAEHRDTLLKTNEAIELKQAANGAPVYP